MADERDVAAAVRSVQAFAATDARASVSERAAMMVMCTRVARLTEQVGAHERQVDWFRDWLWANHGCPVAMLYGDDGERQCHNSAHGPVDFRQWPLLDLLELLVPRSSLAQAQQENTKLKKRVELHMEQIKRFPFCSGHFDKVLGQSCRECERERADALARTLAQALRYYGQHADDCDGEGTRCTCGLDAIEADPAVQALL